MKCDCCSEGYDYMYRTVDTRVYCLPCSRRYKVCCYGKPVVPSTRFRPSMTQHELDSLKARGYKREIVPGSYAVKLSPKRKKK